jgi:glutamine amidotransferase-like uncharacterized protein
VAIFKIDAGSDTETKRLEDIVASESTWEREFLTPTDVRASALDRVDVVVFPGGSGSQHAAALRDEGRQAVREFVRKGGGYVGICAGAFLATAGYDWSLALVNAKTFTGQVKIPGLGMRSMAERGVGTVKIELTEAGKRVFADFPSLVDVPFSGGPILSRAEREDLPNFVALGSYRTEIWTYQPQRGTMTDTPAIIAARFGDGLVIAFSPHPERSEDLDSMVKQAILAVARKPVHADRGD